MRVARMDHDVVVRLCEELLVDNLAELRETEDEDVGETFEAKDGGGKINLIYDTIIKSRKAKKLVNKFIKTLKLSPQRRPTIMGFFAKKKSDTADVHKEAQQMASLLTNGKSLFEPRRRLRISLLRTACMRPKVSTFELSILQGMARSTAGFYG